MKTLEQRGFTNPGSLDHSSFIRWMNRPLARVQVTVYQYAFKVIKEALSVSFGCLPAFRSVSARAQRKIVADRLREIRRQNKCRMKLWYYNMETGNYSQDT